MYWYSANQLSARFCYTNYKQVNSSNKKQQKTTKNNQTTNLTLFFSASPSHLHPPLGHRCPRLSRFLHFPEHAYQQDKHTQDRLFNN
jgi:hypothetical protein